MTSNSSQTNLEQLQYEYSIALSSYFRIIRIHENKHKNRDLQLLKPKYFVHTYLV